MKKTYTAPMIEIEEIECEQILAASGGGDQQQDGDNVNISNTYYNGMFGSKNHGSGLWDED